MCAQLLDSDRKGEVFRSECIDFIIERPITHSKLPSGILFMYTYYYILYYRAAKWSCRLNINLNLIRRPGRIILCSSRS